ncbi:MAG: hypothetical protein LBD23_01255 [Oscillospiraceae bacterium]|jgi:hypothetical protein|nr:hypothetical protein [Oscillospiraceae bacterium]
MPKYDFMQPKIEFLEKDFATMADKLTESYRPSDLAGMAHIGTVLLAMMKLEERENNNPYPYRDKHHIENEGDTHHHSRMNEELHDAEYYYEMWKQTGDMNYHQMAKDELRHADFYIKHARMTAHTPEEQAHVQEALKKQADLMGKLA